MTDRAAWRVLVVDDDALIRKLVSSLVRSNGDDVVGEAANGQEAIQVYKKLSPDVVILDIDMPVRDGFHALRRIKEIGSSAHVVMLTASNDAAVAERCSVMGARADST